MMGSFDHVNVWVAYAGLAVYSVLEIDTTRSS